MICVKFLEYDAKVHIRSKLHYFQLIKDRLAENRRTLFRSTCFGPWLDLNYFANEESLIHYMLQKQIESDDDHYDLPLIYDVNGHHLHFGRRQFHLITGFKFGLPSFRRFRSGDIIFRDRVFPQKVGENLKSIDLLYLIEDEELFTKLSDEDAIRVCLLLSLQVIFMGRDLLSVVDDVYLRMVENLEDWNDFPWGEHIWRQLYDAIRNINSKRNVEYSLAGFVFCFKIWILESSTQSRLWWIKDLDVIPRALSWSKKVPFEEWEYFGMLFPEAKETNHDLYPRRAEADSEWYTKGIRFFNWNAPRPAPVVHGELFEDYVRKRAELRAKAHAMDNEGPAPESRDTLQDRVRPESRDTLQDRVRTLQGICNGLLILPAEVNSLRAQVETIIQDLTIMTSKMNTKIRLVRCPKCRNVLPEPPEVQVYECGGCGAKLQAKKQKNTTVDTTVQRLEEDTCGKKKMEQVSNDQEAGSSSNQASLVNSISNPDLKSDHNDLHSSTEDHDAAENVENSTIGSLSGGVNEYLFGKQRMRQLSGNRNDPRSSTELSGHEDPESSPEFAAHNRIVQEQKQENDHYQEEVDKEENVKVNTTSVEFEHSSSKQKMEELSDDPESDSSLNKKSLANSINEQDRNKAYNGDPESSPESTVHSRLDHHDQEFLSCRNGGEFEESSEELTSGSSSELNEIKRPSRESISKKKIIMDSEGGSKSSFKTLIAEKLLDTRQKKPVCMLEDDILSDDESADCFGIETTTGMELLR